MWIKGNKENKKEGRNEYEYQEITKGAHQLRWRRKRHWGET